MWYDDRPNPRGESCTAVPTISGFQSPDFPKKTSLLLFLPHCVTCLSTVLVVLWYVLVRNQIGGRGPPLNIHADDRKDARRIEGERFNMCRHHVCKDSFVGADRCAAAWASEHSTEKDTESRPRRDPPGPSPKKHDPVLLTHL